MDSLDEVCELLFGIGVIQREHRRDVVYLFKAVLECRTNTLCGRVGSYPIGMLLFDLEEPFHQLVIFVVGNGGTRLHVVEMVVLFNLFD